MTGKGDTVWLSLARICEMPFPCFAIGWTWIRDVNLVFSHFLGLGALGWLGFTDTLGRVEGIIFQSVPVDIPDLNHPVTVSVSRREVLVSDFVNSQDQRACILKQMQRISGHLQITDGLVLFASPVAVRDRSNQRGAGKLQSSAIRPRNGPDNGRMIVSLRHRP